jgi:23S rRNA (adenine2030-N6)-methyltransferase
MFLVNPPHTLQAALRESLPRMVELLGQDRNACHQLESGG